MSDAAGNLALDAAVAAQEKVNVCLDERRNFRLEAGAGAGKTYSLVAALKRIITERGTELQQVGQRVACITYTEVARREIAQEIEDHPAILVNTIHAFSWAFLVQFQKALRDLVEASEDRREKIVEGGGVGAKHIVYDLGYFGVESDRITLSHDDIPMFMAKLLAQKKFRRILTQQFPIIFIDEYQDTDPHFMGAINDHFFSSGEGPLIGLFGDHWQTIYRSEYELADYPVEAIGKGANFRSVPAVVNVLNGLRPELTQAVTDSTAEGEARFFHANAYQGERTNDRSSKDDVLPAVSKEIRELLMERLVKEGWQIEKTKVLMLTHNVLAADQGYPTIAKIFQGRTDQFARKEDPAIKFFAETLEPMCRAYESARYGDMFKLLGAKPAIRAHQDKVSWRTEMDALKKKRAEGTIGDVLEHLRRSKRPDLPERVLRRMEELTALNGEPIAEESSLKRFSELQNVRYKEVFELVKFVEGQTPFATQHSVKGAEFENVLVVLGGGWNHYNWPQLFELLETQAFTAKNAKGYYRARNLFYVSISRPMKRLAVLATQTLSDNALSAATRLFSKEHVVGLEFP